MRGKKARCNNILGDFLTGRKNNTRRRAKMFKRRQTKLKSFLEMKRNKEEIKLKNRYVFRLFNIRHNYITRK